jgi:tricorn protease-like protein
MKRKVIFVAVIIVIGLVFLICLQLFVQPKLVIGNQLQLEETFTHHSNDVWEVKFSPNDSLMISGGIEKNAMIWSRITGEVLHNLPHKVGTPAVDFSPNGKQVATGAYDGNVRTWNVNSGKLINVFEGNKGTVWSVDFSPNGKLIAAGGNDDDVLVWNIDSGKLIHRFNEATHNIWEVVFNPTGELLLSSGSDNAIRVYDVKTGKLLHTILGHSLVPLSMDFSPDGKLLVSAGDDKTVKVWDTSNWSLLHTLKGENEAIHSVVFIDNNRVLAGGTDKSMLGELLEYHLNFKGVVKPIVANLWDVKNEKILQTISDHTDDFGLGMDVSSDGKYIVTPSKDKTVKIWKIIND